MAEKLTADERRCLDYIDRRGASEADGHPLLSLALLADRGLVKAEPWRRERSPTGAKVWVVRSYTLTDAGRAALKGADHEQR